MPHMATVQLEGNNAIVCSWGSVPAPLPLPLPLPTVSHLAFKRSTLDSWPTRSTSACSKLRRLPSEEGTGATTRLSSAQLSSTRTHKLWQQQESHTKLYYYARRAQIFLPSFKQVSNIPAQLAIEPTHTHMRTSFRVSRSPDRVRAQFWLTNYYA